MGWLVHTFSIRRLHRTIAPHMEVYFLSTKSGPLGPRIAPARAQRARTRTATHLARKKVTHLAQRCFKGLRTTSRDASRNICGAWSHGTTAFCSGARPHRAAAGAHSSLTNARVRPEHRFRATALVTRCAGDVLAASAPRCRRGINVRSRIPAPTRVLGCSTHAQIYRRYPGASGRVPLRRRRV